MPQHWMVKQEPTAYSWERFVAAGGNAWTGIRNFQALNNLRAMKKGDLVLFYHAVVGKLSIISPLVLENQLGRRRRLS